LGPGRGEGGRTEGTRIKKENIETERKIITELRREKRKERTENKRNKLKKDR
jgi:hypothetical protein